MSYDFVIEPVATEQFDWSVVERALAGQPQLRREHDESYRSAGGLQVELVADEPRAPVDTLVLHVAYVALPVGFDSACDLALRLAGLLGGRVIDAQLGSELTPTSRAASRERAEEMARWARVLGTEQAATVTRVGSSGPPRTAVAEPEEAAPARRPWWKFWS